MGKPHHPKAPAWSGPIRHTKNQQAAQSAQRGSWWVKYSTGDRRDAAFQAEAEQVVPTQTERVAYGRRDVA